MSQSRTALAVIALLLGSGIAPAQVKEPPRAEKLDVQIRYRIRADRDERIRQFLALEKHLASLGFDDARKNDPDRELDILDPTAERFTGSISASNVMRLLDEPHVLNILFTPAGYTYPDSPEGPVPVRIVIRGGLLPNQQQLLHGQVAMQLALLGFQEALGYDTRGYTQVKGTIPYKNLPALMKDLRDEPSGWFFTNTPRDNLPRPLGDRSPILWVEVMPAVEPPPPFVASPPTAARGKMPPELRAVIDNPALRETPLRVLVIFTGSIDNRIEELRSQLAARFGPTAKRTPDGAEVKGADGRPAFTEGATLDGAIGNMAVIRFDRPADVDRFAEFPGVLTLRLPRTATETITTLADGGGSAAAADLLKASGVESLHRLGYTGAGVKVLLIASDFSGADKLIGNGLPKSTRLLDMTIALNPDVVPMPADPNRAGNGLAAARALALAAPDAELVLVRIDPAAIFQLFTVMRVVDGDLTYSEAFRSRLADIATRTTDISRRKEAAIEEYRNAFADLADDEPAKQRRARARSALDAIEAEQAELVKRIDRLNIYRKELLEALSGARVIVNTLEWESGYPLDSISLLSRTLDFRAAQRPPQTRRRAGDRSTAPKPPLVWVQAASHAGAAVWGGPFLDANTDGTMEFATPAHALPPGTWTREMNFLGFQTPAGETVPELPAGTRLRFTIQWREPLDPNVPAGDRIIHPVVLRLYRQLDPNGERRPSDEMAEEARSIGAPLPILLTSTLVVYEQTLEYTVPAAGRYAAVVAMGYRPDPILPALKREAEILPRMIVETLSGRPSDGRVVFRSFLNPRAGVGIPGDSAGVTTVGSGSPGELIGGGTGLTLRAKPDLFGPAALDIAGAPRGTGVATGFVGGIGVVLVQAGAAGANPFASSGFAAGKPAMVPEFWLKYLRPIRR
jgi:hypothetical protein